MNRLVTFILLLFLTAGCSGNNVLPTPDPDASAAAEHPATTIPLNGRISAANAEISGLAWYGDTLVLLPQYPGRFNDNLYVLSKTDILAFLDGQSDAPLTPQTVPITTAGLEDIDDFEGFEAIVFNGDTVYVTIESSPGSGMMGYLVAGAISPDLSQIALDIPNRVELEPQADLSNYSDEALLLAGDTLVTLYEANGQNVNESPVARRFNTMLGPQRPISFPSIEYRITDATTIDKNGRFWAINYLFPGSLDKLDPAADALVTAHGAGATHAGSSVVERLVEFQYTDSGITFSDTPPLQLELSDVKDGRNWEGLVRLDDRGFLLATDKFPETILAFVPGS